MPSSRSNSYHFRALASHEAVVCTVWLLTEVVAIGHAEPPRAADYVPDNAAIAITLRDGDQHVSTLREALDELGVFETHAYETISTTPEFMQAQVGLAGIASAAKLDSWGAVGAALGREAVAALAPNQPPHNKPNVVLVIIPREPVVMDRLLEIGESMAGLTRRGEPDPARSRKLGDDIAFQVAPELVFCRTRDALVIANDGEFLARAVHCGTTGKNRLSQTKTYRDAEKNVPSGALAWAVVDRPRLSTALHGDAGPPDKINNPLGGFLFGGWWYALRTAEKAVAWIESKPHAVHAHFEVVAGADLPATHRGFAAARQPDATWDERSLPRFIGAIRIDRDWRALFAERESLLTLPAAGDVVNFSNTLTTILGIDFLEELLPAVNGAIRLIAVKPDYSKLSYLPSPRLPSFALAIPLRLDAAGQLARRLNSGSQTALSLINADAMQKGEPTYLLDMDRYRDVRMVFAEFPADMNSGMVMKGVAPDDGEEMTAKDQPSTTKPSGPQHVGVRYNFAMAAAVVGSDYVVATSRDLLERIIDAHLDKKAAAMPTDAPRADSFVLMGHSIIELLRDNREELVTQRMLEQDRTRKQAEEEIDAFLELAAFGDHLEIATKAQGRTHSTDITIRIARLGRSEAGR